MCTSACDIAEAGSDAGGSRLAGRSEAVRGGGSACERGPATRCRRRASGKRADAASGSSNCGSACERHAACGKAGPHGGASAKLWASGDEAICDARTEDAEAEQGQRCENDRHRLVDRRRGAAETCGELREQRRADANDDREHQHLDTG